MFTNIIMTYNPKSANPFTNETYKEWTGNNLILTDPELRRKAGVTVLDADITDIFSRPRQQGGAAYGAPLHMSQYGSPSAVAYNTRFHVNSSAWVQQPMPVHKLAATQTGGEGSFPLHYYQA